MVKCSNSVIKAGMEHYPMSIYRALQLTISVLVICAVSPLAIASPLSDYNLILSSNYAANGTTVWGNAVVGGNRDGSNIEVGTRLDRSTTANSLAVVGDINVNNENLQPGFLTYAG